VLDSVGALAPKPVARLVRGSIMVASMSADSAYGERGTYTPTDRFARSAIDFSPFFGGRIARDVSTTVFGPVDSGFVNEATAGFAPPDIVHMTLIPRISHGRIEMTGQLRGDSITGRWVQILYCCGASGRFAMHRVAQSAPALTLPPRPRPPPPLDTTVLGKARVRVWDHSAGRYIRVAHALRFPDGAWQTAYHTGPDSTGWGKPIWLRPGRYEVEILVIPCGDEHWSLQTPIRRAFVVRRSALSEVSIALDRRALEMSRSYSNPAGAQCPR
jgi:hypothetical protein